MSTLGGQLTLFALAAFLAMGFLMFKDLFRWKMGEKERFFGRKIIDYGIFCEGKNVKNGQLTIKHGECIQFGYDVGNKIVLKNILQEDDDEIHQYMQDTYPRWFKITYDYKENSLWLKPSYDRNLNHHPTYVQESQDQVCRDLGHGKAEIRDTIWVLSDNGQEVPRVEIWIGDPFADHDWDI